jgi:uncharacterized alpha-E superfamily protein
VFDLVLLDDKNPRSVLFQIQQLAQHFERLPRDRETTTGTGKQILADCLARLQQMDARELAGPRESWLEGKLSQGIAEILEVLPRLSDAIAADYFAHSAIFRTGREGEP